MSYFLTVYSFIFNFQPLIGFSAAQTQMFWVLIILCWDKRFTSIQLPPDGVRSNYLLTFRYSSAAGNKDISAPFFSFASFSISEFA